MTEKDQISSQITKQDFIKLQIDQAIKTLRTQLSLGTQIATLLIIADVSIVGYAINNKIAGILFIGALFPIMFWIIYYRLKRLMLPVIYTAVTLENKYGGDDSDWLVSTFVSTIISVEYIESLKEISKIQDPVERIESLKKLGLPKFFGATKVFTTIFFIVLFLQLLLPIILYRIFEWRFF